MGKTLNALFLIKKKQRNQACTQIALNFGAENRKFIFRSLHNEFLLRLWRTKILGFG
jgi:hypothetical protein